MALVFYSGTLPGAVSKDIRRFIDLLVSTKVGQRR